MHCIHTYIAEIQVKILQRGSPGQCPLPVNPPLSLWHSLHSCHCCLLWSVFKQVQTDTLGPELCNEATCPHVERLRASNRAVVEDLREELRQTNDYAMRRRNKVQDLEVSGYRQCFSWLSSTEHMPCTDLWPVEWVPSCERSQSSGARWTFSSFGNYSQVLGILSDRCFCPVPMHPIPVHTQQLTRKSVTKVIMVMWM